MTRPKVKIPQPMARATQPSSARTQVTSALQGPQSSAAAFSAEYRAERLQCVKEFQAGKPQTLEQLCRQELSGQPADDFPYVNLGVILSRAGNLADAEQLYRQGLELFPRSANLLANLSKICLDQRRWPEAKDYSQRAAESQPKMHTAWLNHSYACNMLGLGQEGEASARRACELDPKSVHSLNNLANALMTQSRVKEAVELYERAIALTPDDELAYTNLMLALMYDGESGVEQVQRVARDYAERFEKPIQHLRRPHRNTALPERRLRIGFISPDFTSHAVMYFAEPVLTRLSRQSHEIFGYFTYAAGDGVTQRVKGLVDRFRYVPDGDAKKTAQIIQEDEIDILIDLAGHTAKNGLRTMAYKPAPVQVTWLGYPGTTGLSSIDWRITDHAADVPGADAHYTEKLIRLPGCFAVYRPHIRNPRDRFSTRYQVSAPPALKNGYVTFGSCNNIAKISPQSLEVWSRVLKAVPHSRMLIEGKDLARPEGTQRLRERLGHLGIEEDRIIFVNRDGARQYLTYHDIDIALDTFPLTGGTTTFDCLWMGVPLVSLVGQTFRNRLSTTILFNGGFKEFLCDNTDAYVSKAVALAQDLPALAQRRAGQRQRMQQSVLMDEARYVKLFAQALRMVWRQWCKQQEPDGIQAEKEPLEGEDVVVFVNDKRITFPSAHRWLDRLNARIVQGEDPADILSAQALAYAVLQVCPEDTRSNEVFRQYPYGSPDGNPANSK